MPAAQKKAKIHRKKTEEMTNKDQLPQTLKEDDCMISIRQNDITLASNPETIVQQRSGRIHNESQVQVGSND